MSHRYILTITSPSWPSPPAPPLFPSLPPFSWAPVRANPRRHKILLFFFFFAVKGITAAAVTGGFKLKRAFAARRKKSEDASSLFTAMKGKEPEAASVSGARALSSQVADRVPPGSLSQQPQRMDTPSSPFPRSQVFNKNSPALPSPPPPTPPPKKEIPPSTLSPVQPDAQVLIAAPNRNSIIPISPGISSAVNYLSMIEEQQSRPPSPQPQSQNARSTTTNLTSKVDHPAEKENLKSSTSSSGSDKRDMKESWRKSDSTNSHHTIRPGAGSTRTSRPVSWAESFQSAYTVVQPGTTSRPLSALIGDADLECWKRMMAIRHKKRPLPLLLMASARTLRRIRARMRNPLLRLLLSGQMRRRTGGQCHSPLRCPVQPLSNKALLFLRLRPVHLRSKPAWLSPAPARCILQCPFLKASPLLGCTKCLDRHRLSLLLLRSPNLKYAPPRPSSFLLSSPILPLQCTSNTNGVFRRYLTMHLTLTRQHPV
ncbi:hypothetical protein CPB84DRAFT_384307 [Gymnopilus junonius]|uniref:Uncharacterized protein n=1 Tax=Gymnopilus junonius TaxID=109634 RepID=A0A9P5NCJ1_GYMJU|nr:hypothetical protein CPB84DRAFT_384307 [Gymnopilus junonius]